MANRHPSEMDVTSLDIPQRAMKNGHFIGFADVVLYKNLQFYCSINTIPLIYSRYF